MIVAVTLFSLASDRTLEDYEHFSREFIGPGMLELPSVLGFRDGTALRQMGGDHAAWDGVEVIEISSPEAFEADHEVSPGKDVAALWTEWIDRFEVTFFELIHEG